jgi:hypothetical protein
MIVAENETQYVAAKLFRDLMYLVLFTLQHSIMASPYFKRALRCIGVCTSQRLIYVICTCFAINVSGTGYIEALTC